MNNLIAYTKNEPKLKLEIEYDKNVGYYIYVYDLKTGKCIEDHLQDTLEIAKSSSERKFGVTRDDWQEK